MFLSILILIFITKKPVISFMQIQIPKYFKMTFTLVLLWVSFLILMGDAIGLMMIPIYEGFFKANWDFDSKVKMAIVLLSALGFSILFQIILAIEQYSPPVPVATTSVANTIHVNIDNNIHLEDVIRSVEANADVPIDTSASEVPPYVG